jgi:hypothetical protein
LSPRNVVGAENIAQGYTGAYLDYFKQHAKESAEKAD